MMQGRSIVIETLSSKGHFLQLQPSNADEISEFLGASAPKTRTTHRSSRKENEVSLVNIEMKTATGSLNYRFLNFPPFRSLSTIRLLSFFRSSSRKQVRLFIFATYHVHIDIVAVLYLHCKDFRKSICQLLYTCFSVVDTAAGVESIKKFN